MAPRAMEFPPTNADGGLWSTLGATKSKKSPRASRWTATKLDGIQHKMIFQCIHCGHVQNDTPYACFGDDFTTRQTRCLAVLSYLYQWCMKCSYAPVLFSGTCICMFSGGSIRIGWVCIAWLRRLFLVMGCMEWSVYGRLLALGNPGLCSCRPGDRKMHFIPFEHVPSCL